MRILFLIDKLSPGGTQRHLLRLSRNLHASGIDVHVCCLDKLGLWGKALAEDGIPVTALDCPSIVPPNFRTARNHISEQINKYAPDILHCLLFSANFIGPLAAHRSRQAVSVITSRRDTGFGLGWRHAWALRIANRRVDHICCNSQAVFAARSNREKWTTDRQQHRVTIIPNSVDTSAFSTPPISRAVLGVNTEDWLAVSVARLRPEKGQATIIRAVQKLRDTHPSLRVLLVGDGPEAERLKTLAADCGVAERIIFTGHREDTPAILNAADAAILVSDSEGFANFILEAMAAKKPVIASAVEGNCELVQNQHNGLLVPAGDTQALAAAIDTLYADHTAAATMGEHGRQMVEEKYSPAAEMNAYLALYDSLVKTNNV